MVDADFNDCSKKSLYEFYNEHIDKLETLRFNFNNNKDESDDSFFNMNFFFLIFDALKLFPEFRMKMEDYHKRELEAWIQVVKHAKATGEIKSPMSDRHIAMIFIHTSDGTAMNLVLEGNMENLKKELKSIWDMFYNSLKANNNEGYYKN